MLLPCGPKHSVCEGELLLVGSRESFAEYEQPWELGAYSRSFCRRRGISGDDLSTVHDRHQKPDAPWEHDPISRLT